MVDILARVAATTPTRESSHPCRPARQSAIRIRLVILAAKGHPFLLVIGSTRWPRVSHDFRQRTPGPPFAQPGGSRPHAFKGPDVVIFERIC